VDRASNATLFAKNANMPLPMASTTKLMTVLEALESLSPDQVVSIPEAALVGGAGMGLSAGEQVEVLTLLYGALLPSGNDAAAALALAAEGSEAGFVARMNQQAAEWGLNQTHFANPTGFDAPGHASSALDLAALGRRALANPLVAGIAGQASARIGGYSLQNTNELLGVYEGAYGVKTGTTDAAGQVLIAAARRPSGDALAVLMSSPDRYGEARRLLDFYFGHWLWRDAGLGYDVLNRVTAPDGAVYLLRTPAQPLFLTRWQASQLRTFRTISFDEANQPGGVYQVWLGEQMLLEMQIEFVRMNND
jgi:D-alanyl-D-alanine carboxypeptidase